MELCAHRMRGLKTGGGCLIVKIRGWEKGESSKGGRMAKMRNQCWRGGTTPCPQSEDGKNREWEPEARAMGPGCLGKCQVTTWSHHRSRTEGLSLCWPPRMAYAPCSPPVASYRIYGARPVRGRDSSSPCRKSMKCRFVSDPYELPEPMYLCSHIQRALIRKRWKKFCSLDHELAINH